MSNDSPRGADVIADGEGSQPPSESEFAIARVRGEHVAAVAARLSASS